MSEPNSTADFLSSRAAASTGPASAQYLLNRYGTGTDAAAPAPVSGGSGTTPSTPYAPNANLPFGLRMEQAVTQIGQKYIDAAKAVGHDLAEGGQSVGAGERSIASGHVLHGVGQMVGGIMEQAGSPAAPLGPLLNDPVAKATGSKFLGNLTEAATAVFGPGLVSKIFKEGAAAKKGMEAAASLGDSGAVAAPEEAGAAATAAPPAEPSPAVEPSPTTEGPTTEGPTPNAAPTEQAAEATKGPSISEAAPKVDTGPVDADGFPLEDTEELQRAGLVTEPFKINGESPDRLNVTPELEDQFRKYLNGESGTSPVQPSLEKLGTKEGLEDAITRLATFIPRSGIKADTELRQQSLGMLLNISPDDLMNGPVGAIAKDTADLDARMDAAKILVMSGAEQLQGFSVKAVTTNALEDWQAATRALTLQNQITKTFTEAGTNVGRALRARQLDVFGEGSSAQAFNDIITNVGPDNVEEVIRKMAALPTPEQAAGWTGVLRKMTSRDGLLYGWYNMLLGPATVAKKLTSDAVVATLNVASRYAAEKFGSGAVAPGETASLVSGYAGSFMDALSAAAKALKTGHSNFMSDYQTMDGTTVTRLEKLVGSGDAQIDAAHTTNAAFALLRAGLPTTWIGAADDFAKVMNYRAEARSLLLRQGSAEGLEGAALDQHITDNLSNMPDDIHAQAKAAALLNTFQDPLTGIAANLQDTMDSLNLPVGAPLLGWKGFDIPVGRMLMPFVKVPANIMKFAYRNSPLPLISPSDGFKADLMAGGARRDLAYARVGIGTGISLAASGLAISGDLTGGGPNDPGANAAWQRAGNMPYSIKVGGKSYGYNKIEPTGMLLSAIADTFNVAKFAKDEDNDNIAASLVFGLGSAVLSKTYMSGIANFFDALDAPEQEGQRYFNNLATSMAVPNIVGSVDKGTDAWRRAHYSLLQSIEAKTPGLSEGLPPVRTIWGDPIPQDQGFAPPLSGTGAARALSPVPFRDQRAEPIDSWIWDNRQSFPTDARGNLQLPSKPGHVQTWALGPSVDAHVALSPEQYDRLVDMAGNSLKVDKEGRLDANGLGAKDYLNALVAGNNPDSATQRQWNNGSPSVKALLVSTAIGKFRKAAKDQLRGEFPDIEQAINAQATDRTGQLTGTAQ